MTSAEDARTFCVEAALRLILNSHEVDTATSPSGIWVDPRQAVKAISRLWLGVPERPCPNPLCDEGMIRCEGVDYNGEPLWEDCPICETQARSATKLADTAVPWPGEYVVVFPAPDRTEQ